MGSKTHRHSPFTTRVLIADLLPVHLAYEQRYEHTDQAGHQIGRSRNRKATHGTCSWPTRQRPRKATAQGFGLNLCAPPPTPNAHVTEVARTSAAHGFRADAEKDSKSGTLCAEHRAWKAHLRWESLAWSIQEPSCGARSLHSDARRLAARQQCSPSVVAHSGTSAESLPGSLN